jgi:hypothetical protein
MERYKFSKLTLKIIKQYFQIQTKSDWKPEIARLTESEIEQVKIIAGRLQSEQIHRFNEATVWGKAVYPLLILSETETNYAWAEFPVKALFKKCLFEGIIDGVVGEGDSGQPTSPHLIVVEGKKGLEGKDPLYQLYGAMLAVAKLNFDDIKQDKQTIYGCYTISDSWTFLRGEVEKLESDKPIFKVETSREFIERFEAEVILGILKAITNKNEQN